MWVISLLLVIFGLFVTLVNGNIGEGQNFIIAGLVFAILSGPVSVVFNRRR